MLDGTVTFHVGGETYRGAAPSTPADALAALARYDVEVTGPHPRDRAAAGA